MAVLWAWSHTAQAQDHWAYDFGGVGNDHVADVKVDPSGAVFVTGEFHGAMTYDGVGVMAAGGIDFFVARLNSDGSLVWIQHAGGPGIDRGMKLAVNSSGDLAVVGEFMATVDFFGTTLTSAGGTPDMFVALFDAATGNLQWVRQGGGADGSDRPYGVDIASNGDVIVGGEFKGTATWNSSTLVSVPEPFTLVPSVDVVILSYSAAGTLNWLQQGAAEHTDRAIDVEIDPFDNIYVTGQFSDTITFDQVHNNAMFNATFLLRFDLMGNEVWFKRAGGAIYNHVRDMQWASSGNLALTGDLQGTMIYLDAVPDMIDGQDPYAYYLLEVDANGELQEWSVLGSNEPVSARALDERNDTLAVLGQFNCTFSDLSDLYGVGLFLATGDQDLFVSRHRLSSLGLIDAQQFGGQEEKLAGQIASLPGGSLLFSGSFEHAIIFPADEDFIADIDNYYGYDLLHLGSGTTYCGDQDYHFYAADTSKGLKDGFLARGFIPGRSVYDFWKHVGGVCMHDTMGLCLGDNYIPLSCQDSISHCGPWRIGVRPEFNFTIINNQFFTGPELDFLWSTGSTGDSLWVYTTGWYWVQATTTNGCLAWTDSIHVTIWPLPAEPGISDDVVENINAIYTDDIHLCDPDSAWLWCAVPLPGYTYQWNTPSGVVYNDSCIADTSGYYTLVAIAPGGCLKMNVVEVHDHPTVPLPAITGVLDVYFPQDGDLNDTIELCPGSSLTAAFTASWSVGGLPYTLPPGIFMHWRFNWGGWNDTPIESQSDFVPGAAPGWNTVILQLWLKNTPCGDDSIFFTSQDSVFLITYPDPPLAITITGPTLSCPGDTVTWLVDCVGCMSHYWVPPVLQDFGDSVLVLFAGEYDLHASAMDSTGCYNSDFETYELQHPQTPELYVDPLDGIICPDTTAIIYTNALGTDYEWFGPMGPVPNNNDSVITGTPGEYYMSFTDTMGCFMISDPILITGYSTPFLNVTPDAVICVGTGETVTLQVVTTGYTSLAWAPPLSGSALTQVISIPGTYTVSVAACGITTTLGVTIIGGSAEAALVDPGPYVICSGQPLTVQATPGMAGYTWDPGPVYGPVFTITQAGTYSLSVFDSNGCTDDTTFVVVEEEFTDPAIITGDTVCQNGTGILLATGSGTLDWYASPDTTQWLGSGGLLSIPMAQSTATYYVLQNEGNCSSIFLPVNLQVDPIPTGVIASVADTNCAGTAIQIDLIGPPGMDAAWSTPGGPMSGVPLIIDPASSFDTGYYTAYTFLGDCPGDTVSIGVEILDPMPPDIGPDTTICAGGTYTFTLPVGYTDPLWSDGSTGTTLTVVGPGAYGVQALDANGCWVQTIVQLTQVECAPVMPTVFTPNGDGVNDDWLPTGGGYIGASMIVFNRYGETVYEGDPVRRAFDGLHYITHEELPEGVYYYVIRFKRTDGDGAEHKGYFQLIR